MNIFEDLFLEKVNGVSDTKTFIGVGLWDTVDSELLPLITCRTKGNLRQYFLCDFVKIWQHKISRENDD